MRILVTGGAGFIGGHLAERFLREGHDVVVLDDFHPFYDLRLKEHTVELHEEIATEEDVEYRLVEGDVRNENLVTDLVSESDFVYHQAARAGVRSSVEDPRAYDSVNVDGTLNVLDAARDSDVERVVVASSSSVYGKPVYLPYDEDHPTTPISPYGASKLAGERYACAYNGVYDVSTVALRYFTVYGPRMRPNMAISNFVSRCNNDDSPVIYGDGTQTRDFTYIDDVVEANLQLLGTDVADGQAVNIGSNDTIQIRTLAEEVRDQMAPGVDLEYAKRFAADAEHTHADIDKARDLLGYEASHTIREGVGEFIDWYQQNEDWYEPLVHDA